MLGTSTFGEIGLGEGSLAPTTPLAFPTDPRFVIVADLQSSVLLADVSGTIIVADVTATVISPDGQAITITP